MKRITTTKIPCQNNETVLPSLSDHESKKEVTNAKGIDTGRNWGQEEKVATEDEMVGWYHRLNGHEFE